MVVYINSESIKRDNYEYLVNKYPNITFEDKLNEVSQAEVVISLSSFVVKDNLDKFPNLKWIQLLTAGFDTIDLDAVKERNIVVTNAKGVYSIPIAEDVITKILVLNKNVPMYLKNMEDSLWLKQKKAYELSDSVVGILGAGSIAKEIAKRIKCFGTKVIGYRRKNIKEEYFDNIYYGDDGLNYLLKNSDYVIVTLSLNNNTKGLINIDKLRLMKKEALLINIARGEIINHEDLVIALRENSIRGAGLDVTYPEPLPEDNPLWKMDNVIITPHVSYVSPFVSKRLIDLIETNLNNYINHQDLINLIND